MGNVVHILDGAVALYQREYMGTQTWTARYKIRNMKGYVTKATGKRDLEEAKDVAREKHAELTADFRRGIPIRSRTFKLAVNAYLEDLQTAVLTGKATERTMKDNKAVINRYLLPYFESKAIDAIRQEQIEAYKLWRLTYWTEGPGAKDTSREYMRGGKLIKAKRPQKTQTQRSGEIFILKAIFNSARKRGWVKRDQIPDIDDEQRKTARRPAFTEAEWKRILAAMPTYINGAKGLVVEADRKMVCAYVEFMFETGLRPGKEHQQLTWADCELITNKAEVGVVRETHVHIRDDTKTGKRTAVSSEATWDILNQIKAFSPWTKPSDPIFADRKTGKPILSFAKGVSALLKTVGLEYDRNGVKFSPYSLRHTYATDRLIKGRLDVWLLAKNMGTSVEMIRKHYGQDEPKQRSHELIHDKVQLDTDAILALLRDNPALAAEILSKANLPEGPTYDPDAPVVKPDPNAPRKRKKFRLTDMIDKPKDPE
ncbi:tyrosine-type recombinase/integrase [Paramagnetospirillum magneticum]|uniref:Tyr recombinase domain-containing protein n=1 Tax=Paramagnetospirillum magneticum (strain ATCC 700264 / AMB-1) TaxID=342108 RepID=Q2W0P4_PARM1|nr:tyrosine-type recombinase/integrase [Paramagnetospirillum magneticum]BAE52581.1 hypothetical protein amb3777 [Paramagnetospirillum magneticum AMB-1]